MKRPNRTISFALSLLLVGMAVRSNAVEELTKEQRIDQFVKLPKAERQKLELFAMKQVVEDSARRVAAAPDYTKIKLSENEEILRVEYRVKEKMVFETLIVQKAALLNRSHVAECFPCLGEHGWELSLKFTDDGKKLFGQATQKAVGHRIAMVFGCSIVLCAPTINEPITGGAATISGGLDEQSARNITLFFEAP